MIVRAVSAMFFTAFLSNAVSADTGHSLNGIASVYAYRDEPTANGEIANPEGLTAAHRTLPFGTRVRVTNLETGKTVVVRINDRGPFVKGRVIDLTPRAATEIGFEDLALVDLTVVN